MQCDTAKKEEGNGVFALWRSYYLRKSEMRSSSASAAARQGKAKPRGQRFFYVFSFVVIRPIFFFSVREMECGGAAAVPPPSPATTLENKNPSFTSPLRAMPAAILLPPLSEVGGGATTKIPSFFGKYARGGQGGAPRDPFNLSNFGTGNVSKQQFGDFLLPLSICQKSIEKKNQKKYVLRTAWNYILET